MTTKTDGENPRADESACLTADRTFVDLDMLTEVLEYLGFWPKYINMMQYSDG